MFLWPSLVDNPVLLIVPVYWSSQTAFQPGSSLTLVVHSFGVVDSTAIKDTIAYT